MKLLPDSSSDKHASWMLDNRTQLKPFTQIYKTYKIFSFENTINEGDEEYATWQYLDRKYFLNKRLKDKNITKYMIIARNTESNYFVHSKAAPMFASPEKKLPDA